MQSEAWGKRLGAVVVVVLLALPSLSHADLIPSEVAACRDAEVGDPCALDSAGDETGECRPSTCSRRKSPSPDSESVTYDCLRCANLGPISMPDTEPVITLERHWCIALSSILVGLGLIWAVYRFRGSRPRGEDDGDDQ